MLGGFGSCGFGSLGALALGFLLGQLLPRLTQFGHPRFPLPLIRLGLLSRLFHFRLLPLDLGNLLLRLLLLLAQLLALLLGLLGLGNLGLLIHERRGLIGGHGWLLIEARINSGGVPEIAPPEILMHRLGAGQAGDALAGGVIEGDRGIRNGGRPGADEFVLGLAALPEAAETPAVPAEVRMGIPAGVLHHVRKDV